MLNRARLTVRLVSVAALGLAGAAVVVPTAAGFRYARSLHTPAIRVNTNAAPAWLANLLGVLLTPVVFGTCSALTSSALGGAALQQVSNGIGSVFRHGLVFFDPAATHANCAHHFTITIG